MITGIQASCGYEIMATANLLVVNYCDSSESWKVSELVSKVKQQVFYVRDLEVILNLEDVTNATSSMMKSVWQVARLLKQRGITAKCVLPATIRIPAFEAFSVNGLVELYESVDQIIHEDETSETWSNHKSEETLVW